MKVSLIITTHNAGTQLADALSVFVQQSLSDIEIICVDNCSTDDSRDILLQYAQSDSRIRPVLCNADGGMMHARSKGVKIAQSEFVLFVDSISRLNDDAYKDIAKLLDCNKADILCFEAHEKKVNTQTSGQHGSSQKSRLLTGHRLVEAVYEEEQCSYSLHNKLFRTEIIKKAYAQMPQGHYSIGEEDFIVFLALYYSRSLLINFGSINYRPNNSRTLDDDDFSREDMHGYCASATLVAKLYSFLEREGELASHLASWNNLRCVLLRKNARKWYLSAKHEDTSFGFDCMIDAWGAESICRYLLGHHFEDQAAIADKINGAVHLQPHIHPVRTIGTFYYRISNGGLERVLASHIRTWVEMGYRVVLYTDKEPCSEDYPYPQEVKRIILPDSFSEENTDHVTRFVALYKSIQHEGIDVFIHQAWLSEILLWDMLAVKLQGVPFVQATHGVFSCPLTDGSVHYAKHMETLTHIYRLNDLTLTLSNVNAAYWKLYSRRTEVVVNPCHLSTKNYSPSRLESHDVLWVGRIAPEKHLRDAIEAMHMVVAHIPDARLIVVGKADPCYLHVEESAKERIKQLALESSIVFEGYHEDLTAHYTNASVFISTSEYEGYPMAIAESKVFGLPCVTYDLPYISFAEHPNEGLMRVKQGDVKGMADVIVRLLTDDNLRLACGKQARLSAEQFSNEHIRDKWEKILRSFEAASNVIPADISFDSIMVNTLLTHIIKGIENSSTKNTSVQKEIDHRWAFQRVGHKVRHGFLFLLRNGPKSTYLKLKQVLAMHQKKDK